MTDIVERLRWMPWEKAPTPDALKEEAADIIVALRTELDAARAVKQYVIARLQSPDEAMIEAQAVALHAKMEHLEPTFDSEWEALNERQKEFYRLCVEALLPALAAVLSAPSQEER